MVKKNKVVIIKDPNCLNCGYPFSHDEKFCPECGQKNRGKKITLGNFLKEIFAGFLSWDSKFWHTLIPLLIRPGKVSKDYIEGKRNRYTNPFRFYITTSIIFFLIIGATDSYRHFEELRNGQFSNGESHKINKNGVETDRVDMDSIQNVVFEQLEKQDSIKTKLSPIKKDSSTTKNPSQQSSLAKTSFDDSFRIVKFMKFQKTHPKVNIDDALDSLHVSKDFSNRFIYSRAAVFNSIFLKRSEIEKFARKLLSYGSVSLFVLLPLFTLFLKLIYIRKRYTYVEHLVFVFHIQTVFFLIFSIFLLIDFFKETSFSMSIFLLLFMAYLFVAMKKFYEQGYIKTFIKYILANTMFFILAFLGSFVVSVIAFALY